MKNLNADEFTSALAAKEPVPGGGGAAALCGALSSALGSMVINYTLGKKKYAGYEAELSALLGECGSLIMRFLELIDEDAEAFEPLSRAYGIPKDDPEREEKLELCLKNAASAPLEMARLAARTTEISAVLCEKGSTLMISDAGCAAALAKAAAECAALNVKVNTRLMKNRETADALNAEIEALLEETSTVGESVLRSVSERLG